MTSEVEKIWCLGYGKEDERERPQKDAWRKRKMHRGKERKSKGRDRGYKGRESRDSRKIFCFIEDIEIGFAHRFGTSIPQLLFLFPRYVIKCVDLWKTVALVCA